MSVPVLSDTPRKVGHATQRKMLDLFETLKHKGFDLPCQTEFEKKVLDMFAAIEGSEAPLSTRSSTGSTPTAQGTSHEKQASVQMKSGLGDCDAATGECGATVPQVDGVAIGAATKKNLDRFSGSTGAGRVKRETANLAATSASGRMRKAASEALTRQAGAERQAAQLRAIQGEMDRQKKQLSAERSNLAEQRNQLVADVRQIRDSLHAAKETGRAAATAKFPIGLQQQQQQQSLLDEKDGPEKRALRLLLGRLEEVESKLNDTLGSLTSMGLSRANTVGTLSPPVPPPAASPAPSPAPPDPCQMPVQELALPQASVEQGALQQRPCAEDVGVGTLPTPAVGESSDHESLKPSEGDGSPSTPSEQQTSDSPQRCRLKWQDERDADEDETPKVQKWNSDSSTSSYGGQPWVAHSPKFGQLSSFNQ